MMKHKDEVQAPVSALIEGYFGCLRRPVRKYRLMASDANYAGTTSAHRPDGAANQWANLVPAGLSGRPATLCETAG